MDSVWTVIDLLDVGGVGRELVGGKAAVLGELAVEGFPVPSGFVVASAAAENPDGLASVLAVAAVRVGSGRFAVRSSGAVEDLPDASYAGLYESYLGVESANLAEAVLRCIAAADADRVRAYRDRRSSSEGVGARPRMAVLVQRMVDAVAAGVAFTANPVSGDRGEIVVTAVRGLGERLVSGESIGEDWVSRAGQATRVRPSPDGASVLDPGQAVRVAELAARVADRYGYPQDIEWAIDTDGRLWLLQARPMTALPGPVEWVPPGPGLWMRNFRLGEWLPEAVTPLFADWLLPQLEGGYLDGMRSSIGTVVPFRYAVVHGWYYTATPVPSPRLLTRAVTESRGRVLRVLFNALVRVNRNPVAADRAVLRRLDVQWRREEFPRYRSLVARGERDLGTATPDRIPEIVDDVTREAGAYLWFLAIVGGSAWKIEACLVRFCREHLTDPLDQVGGTVQVLLRGLPGTEPETPPHAVQSVDWFHPVAGELPQPPPDPGTVAERHDQLASQRVNAETACRAALADRPRLLARFTALLDVAQRYTVIREEQARDFTLGWPLLRACARRLGEHLLTNGAVDAADDLFFLTRTELDTHLHTPQPDRDRLVDVAARRRTEWERQRRLGAPLTLGTPPRLVGDLIAKTVEAARGTQPVPDGAIIGQPASPGRATGPVRVLASPDDFTRFAAGEILVAKATAPAWTPLFAFAAAVVTDSGTLAAHASLIAREYGIPAVVGTGNATTRLRTGQIVTVDGTNGVVIPTAQIP